MKESIYYFNQGIPGFEANREFRLIEEDDNQLAQLISVEDEGIGFILMRPGVLFSDYRVDVNAENEEFLKLNLAINKKGDFSNPTDTNPIVQAEVWVIVTLNQQDMKQTTLNLRAPILLNAEKKLGVQLILADERYSARQPLVLSKPLDRDQKGVVD